MKRVAKDACDVHHFTRVDLFKVFHLSWIDVVGGRTLRVREGKVKEMWGTEKETAFHKVLDKLFIGWNI